MSNDTPESADSKLVHVYDTTLRDGTQREGMSLSCEDKLRIARRLDEFGVAFIEGGWPGSNPKDVEFFARARDMEWQNAKISAFGSTGRAHLDPTDDPQLSTLIAAGTEVCTIFGKTWTLHVTEVLRTTLEENLRMIEHSVAYLVGEGRRVIYDAEHFFDGYAADASYAIETLKAAKRGGAEVLTLCDTNGGNLPWGVQEIVRDVVLQLEHAIGIHTHDDSGCAVANSLAALRGGARHVQGTINGYGERCGNANLCSVIPDAQLKMGLNCLPSGKLLELFELAHFVADVANLPADEHAAFVGRSAYAHKGGVHVSAMRREATSYQHCDPELVGNRCRVVVSELSGRSNVLSKAEELGLKVTAGAGMEVLAEIKQAEAIGYAYEGAEASVALLMKRKEDDYEPPFSIVDYQCSSGRRGGTHLFAEATVKVAVGDELMLTAAAGSGPVAALDEALRKALVPFFPDVAKIHLADYKVRILDGINGTDATTRVLIDSRMGKRAWSTVGASSNIIEASLEALVDQIEYGLMVLDAQTVDAVTHAEASAVAEAS